MVEEAERLPETEKFEDTVEDASEMKPDVKVPSPATLKAPELSIVVVAVPPMYKVSKTDNLVVDAWIKEEAVVEVAIMVSMVRVPLMVIPSVNVALVPVRAQVSVPPDNAR